jgi:hypothetical protein
MSTLQTVKISELVAATSVSASDDLPIVQSGVTKKADSSLIGSARPYKVYTAQITFNGGSIIANVLENSIGDGSGNGTTDIAWSNPDNGVIRATMSTGIVFPALKTWTSSGAFAFGSSLYFVSSGRWGGGANNNIDFVLTLHDNTRTGTPNFSNLYIEIRVYN